MGFSRSIGSLVVRIAAEGIGAYKSELNTAADVTQDAANKIEAATSKAGDAVQVLGGQVGASSAEIEGLSAVAAVAGLGVTALAAGFAVAGYAAFQGSKEAKAYEVALIMTGNAAGVTRSQMAGMAADISKVVGTQGQASAALIAMVNTGAVAGENLQKFTQTAIEMERTVGQKVGDTAKIFEQLGDAPVKASIKLNESLNYLTASTFAQIKAAEELGDKEAAASIAQNAYATAVQARVVSVEANLGTLQKAWRSVGEMAKMAWDKMMNLGRETGPEQALAAQRVTVQNLESQLARGGLGTGGIEKQLGAARETLGVMQENVRLGQRAAQNQAQQAESEKAKIKWSQDGVGYRSDELKLEKTIERIRFEGAAAGATEVEIQRRINIEKEKGVKAGGRGGASAAANDEANAKIEALKRGQAQEEILTKQSVDRINSERRRGVVSEIDAIDQIAAAEMKAINSAITTFEAEKVIAAGKKNSKKEVAALDGQIAAAKEKLNGRELAQGYALLELSHASALENAKNNADLIEGLDKAALAVDEQTKREREAIEVIGLDAKAIAALEIARINDTAASKDRMAALMAEIDPAIAQGYREQAAALRGLAVTKGEKQGKTELNAATEKAKQEQVDLWKQIDSTAESVFMDIAKNGTSAFKHLEDELKNGLLKLLYEMTVKKWIISIGSDISGIPNMGDLMGGGGSPLTKLLGGGLDSMLGNTFGIGGIFGASGSAAVSAGAVSGVSTTGLAGIELASQGLTTLAPAIETLGVVAPIATTGAAALGTGIGGMATAALGAIPVVGWLALGAAALFSIFGSGKDKIPTVLNDLALFNNSLVGLPFLKLAIGSDEAAQGLRDVLYGLENASPTTRKLAGETVNLSIELMRASGDIAGAANLARNLGTRGMSEAEIAVYDYNQELRNQIEQQHANAAAASAGAAAAQAAEQAEKQLFDTRYQIAGKLNILLGRQTQVQFDRATALAATTDAASIGMLQLTYQLEDLYTAVDASYAKLERSIAKEKEFANVRLKGATDLVTALKTTRDAITPSLDRASAQSQIAMYLALAKAGGVLPTAAMLKPALDAVAKPATDLFSSFEDYMVDQARTANDISDLSGYADAQVSEAQQMIERLDLQLDTAKQALDVMKGVDTSVMGVGDAVKAFEASMLALAGAKSSAASYSFAAPTAYSGGGGGGGGYSGGGASSAGSTAGMDSDIVAFYNAYYGRAPDQAGHDAYLQSGWTGDKLSQAILHGSIADRAGADYAYAVSHGYNPDDPMANYVKSKKAGASAAAVEDYGSFAVGSNYIPYDMTARIHQGEEITPKPFVDMQRASREESNRLMERLVLSNERLEKKVEALESAAISNANHASKTASLLDDVVNGGKTINTLSEVAA